jgi:hypothetical protein
MFNLPTDPYNLIKSAERQTDKEGIIYFNNIYLKYERGNRWWH